MSSLKPIEGSYTTWPMNDDTPTPTRFEEILSALEAQVDRLERGELPLEEALDAFTRGMALAEQGSSALDAAEKRVERLLSVQAGQVETEPFDAAP